MMRGGPALRITPAPGTLTVAAGGPKLTVLNRLNDSKRNCRLYLSVKLNFLNKPMSNETVRSILKMLRPELPKLRTAPPVPGRTEGAPKQEVSNQRFGLRSDRLPLQRRLGSTEPRPVFVTSPAKIGVNGSPDCAAKIPLSSQPPTTWCRGPLPDGE